jgi:hypothetical protein
MNILLFVQALRAALMVGFRRCVITAWREVERNLKCAEPLYSCGYEEPCRWLQCGFEVVKVNRKERVFHSFLGFSHEIADFCLFLDLCAAKTRN